MKNTRILDRRRFMATSVCLTTGLIGLNGFSQNTYAGTPAPADSVFVIGPVEGYSPQIGTIVSMLNYNRFTIENLVRSLTQEQLDYLHDEKANTIGGMLLHLGATEKFYQINTFEGREDYNEDEKMIWGAAMSLGDEGRKNIKGKDVKHYLDAIAEVRNYTLTELKKKDDEWLLAIDPKWSTERPLNTYWKWFHVCEHEANHRGQIAWLKSRLPGAKGSGE
jgi:uncharacterized damage-inducible protein DinB